jgi:hypothetical protein
MREPTKEQQYGESGGGERRHVVATPGGDEWRWGKSGGGKRGGAEQ